MNRGGFVLWFTGLSGAGKSTLANLTAVALRERGVPVEILDGDEIRTHLSKGLGFSREDRDTSVRRIGYVAKVVARVGACAITAAISPYRETRDEIRGQIERFVEVYLACSIPVLAARDPKGLYEKALKGEIRNFTGVDDPYEPPLTPEVTLDTATQAPDACVAAILAKLEALGYLEEGAPKEAELVAAVGEIPVVAAVDGAASAPRVPLADPRDAVVLGWIASGVVAPINGPLGERDLVRIRKEQRLERGILFDAELTIGAPPATVGDVVLTADGEAVAKLEGAASFRDPGADRDLVGGRLAAVSHPLRGLAARVRADLIARSARRNAALFVERPLHAGDLYLARIAVESCDALIVVALGAPAVADISAALAGEGLAERVIVVELPALAGMEDGGAPLTRAVVAKNLGAGEIVLRDVDEPLEARRADIEKELGILLRPRLETFVCGAEIRSERTRRPGGAWQKVAR
ncbi:MAG: adenylyl-sulfate kinase [Polyangiaceae bacterium]